VSGQGNLNFSLYSLNRNPIAKAILLQSFAENSGNGALSGVTESAPGGFLHSLHPWRPKMFSPRLAVAQEQEQLPKTGAAAGIICRVQRSGVPTVCRLGCIREMETSFRKN